MSVFESKYDVGIFLGYSYASKTFRIFNNKTLTIEESIYVIFDECTKDDMSTDLSTLSHNFDIIDLENESEEDEPYRINRSEGLELEVPTVHEPVVVP